MRLCLARRPMPSASLAVKIKYKNFIKIIFHGREFGRFGASWKNRQSRGGANNVRK
jgi:hypothetical protein